MLKFFLKNLARLFLVLLLAICVWLIVNRNSHRTSSRAGALKQAALTVWLPIQKSISWVITFPGNTLDAVRELRNLRQEVNRLQLENQTLNLELSNHKSLESEISRLKDILQVKARLPHKARIARIIAHDPGTWNKSFVIDSGAADGIQVDSPVITEQGIVGRVLETTPKYSRVLMLTDTDSSVAGIDQRSGVTGIIQGTGRSQLKFGYVNANEDVQPNDVIVSSGLGGIFPKGYVLGSVVKKTTGENGLSLDIEVAPVVDFASLDYVFLLPPINVYQ